MRGRTFTEPKRPKPKETKIPTPSSCQEVLAAEAKAKDLDEQYLLNRNRDPTTIERMGGPRAVSKAYVDVLEMCARYLYAESGGEDEEKEKLRKMSGRCRMRIMQLEDDQARWSAMEWKVQPVANMTFWVYVFTGVIALCLLIYFEEEHGVTPFGTTLFEWLFAMKGRNVKLEIPKSDGGVLQLEHTSQFHYAIQNYGYILVQFCIPNTKGCEYMMDQVEAASAILQGEGLHENFAYMHYEELAPHVRRRFGVHHYPLLVQFHGPKVIGYYENDAADCDDHEHCIYDPMKIAEFCREKVKIHELDEL